MVFSPWPMYPHVATVPTRKRVPLCGTSWCTTPALRAGLTAECSEKDLDNAYRKMAKKMHPDKHLDGWDAGSVLITTMKVLFIAGWQGWKVLGGMKAAVKSLIFPPTMWRYEKHRSRNCWFSCSHLRSDRHQPVQHRAVPLSHVLPIPSGCEHSMANGLGKERENSKIWLCQCPCLVQRWSCPMAFHMFTTHLGDRLQGKAVDGRE